MKLFKISFIIILSFPFVYAFGYDQDTTKSVSDQIKVERDIQLNELLETLKKNELEIQRLTAQLTDAEKNKVLDKDKIAYLEKIQLALDKRTKTLEEAPKTRANFNGQLAFTELLSIQRDLQPAQLFLSSQDFFSQLGNISNLQKYNSFKSWRTEYNKWYKGQDKSDKMLALLNNSINMISNVSNNVPLYGPIVQSVCTGVTTIIYNVGKKNRELAEKTPPMLELLNAVSQFESQKAIIDHEWIQINKELEQLQVENETLLKDQLRYYGIHYDDYKRYYLDATLEAERDAFKNDCRRLINDKLQSLDSDPDMKRRWLGQVETYMYKVQSLRIRFGEITNRMLSNIDKYEELITLFSDDRKFPGELTAAIKGLDKTLSSVRKNFSATFKPEKYIADSAVMYIERA